MAQKGVHAWQSRTNSFPLQLSSCCNNLDESLQGVALMSLRKCCMCHQGQHVWRPSTDGRHEATAVFVHNRSISMLCIR